MGVSGVPGAAAMIPPPPSVQLCSELTLYAGLGIAAAFGLGLVALGVRSASEAVHKRDGLRFVGLPENHIARPTTLKQELASRTYVSDNGAK